MPFIELDDRFIYVPPEKAPGPAAHPLAKIKGLVVTWDTPVADEEPNEVRDRALASKKGDKSNEGD